MIRRSRISVRPNVKPAVRTAAPSREVHADLKNHAVKTGAQEIVTEVLSVETKEKPESPGGDVPSQSDLTVNAADVEGQSASTSSVSTRRKRFSVLPNLTKHRSTPSSMLTSSKLHKSHARPEVLPAPPRTSSAVPESPDKNKPNKEPAPEPLPNFTEPTQSPAPTLPSSSVHGALNASRFHTKAVTTTRPPHEKTLRAPEPASVLPPAPPTPSERKSKRRKIKPVTPTQDKTETSSSIPDKVEPHSANQDAAESSPPKEEVPADPLVSVSVTPNEPDLRDGSDLSSPGESNKPQRNVPLALRTLNDPVDRLRLARARKLRELLKKEINKDKTKLQRVEPGISHRNKIMDHTKMTMRELIYYLPSTNPMSSYGEDEPRAETDSPSSPKAAPAVPSASVEDAVEEEEDGEGEEEEPLLAPRVKVAEDGSLIIDEESLTVRVQRMKGPNPVEERDPIFERGSTTTYSSFRKGTYTKPWSSRETDMFFLAISMVGTDFSMIGQLFPHRARIEIKNKFKKEERANSWRIDKAFKEKRCLDLDFFSKLLARILKDEEKKRTKRKRASQISKLHRRRPGERKRKICSSDSEEDKSSSSDAMDGENEDEGSSAAPKRNRGGASQKKDKPSAEQEAEEEPERTSPAQSRVNELDSQVEQETERFSVKPGQRKAQDTHSSIREEKEKRELHDSTAYVPEKTTHTYDVMSCGMQDSENEEEPDLSTIQEHILNKPTRSGRIPKLSQQMIRAAADEEEDDDEEEQLRPLRIKPDPRPRAERGMWSASNRGKSRLLTLRALTTEEDDDDDEDEQEECGTNREEENYPMNAEEENQAFVPMGLRSVRTDQSQVEETMEELDISVNVPDMLGISQNVVCPWSSCPRALTGMGSVSSEHQLNLHVGVNDFMAPDHMEVSEEAARTLLTIGHSAHVTQTGEPSAADDVIVVEEPSIPVHETVHMETPNESETAVETCDAVTSDPSSSITSQTDPVITGNRTPTQDSVSTAEPISSQERKLPSDIVQPETVNIVHPETVNIVQPEATLLNTRRKRLPKPDLNKPSRTTRNEAAEAHTCCAETFSSKTTPSQISPRTHDVPEEQHHDQTEGRSAVLLLEKKMEDGDTGRCVEDETQQAEGEANSSSDLSMKPSQSVRRSKPKPNLVRSVRTTHTQRKRHTVPDEETEFATRTFTSIQQPEEGANVTSAPIHSVTATPHTNTEEHSGAVCDESPFIHSLTEVLPTLTERAGLVPDPLPLPETLSEPISAVEHASADVGATGPAGDQVFSQLLPDVLIPVSDTHETGKDEERVCKRRRLPERGRRDQLQIKTNPVRRLSRLDAPSSHQTTLEQPQPQPASSLSACSSSAGCENSKTSPSSEHSREISPPPVRNETPPTYSPPPPHSIGENVNLSQLDPVESTATQVGAGSQPVHQITLPTSTGPMMRPVRRPKGFLSFMSSTRRPSEPTRAPPKAAVIPSRNAPRPAAASTATPRPPSSLPHPHPPHTSSRTQAETPSADQEPTSVSAFFFNNIFTVVDEQDGLD